jgi:L-cystine uptake protein TcyP (sodium:dicarboxylate symporter family)
MLNRIKNKSTGLSQVLKIIISPKILTSGISAFRIFTKAENIITIPMLIIYLLTLLTWSIG